MEFGILGPLEARDGDRIVALGGARQRAVLALLLLRSNEVVSRDRLIDELWAENPPPSAVNVLQTYVWHLRKALPAETLQTRGGGYVLQVTPDQLDLHQFERLLGEAGRALAGGEAESAARLAREALQLWRGPPLADFAYEPFAQASIARLDELRLTALESRIEADLTCGRHDQLVGELGALVREHPLRERLRVYLMLALYRCGRQAEALAVYRDARLALVAELGIDPGPALQDLERAILRHDPALDAPQVGSAVRPPAERVQVEGSILVVPRDDDALPSLLSIAEPLARRPPRELIVARLLAGENELAAATTRLGALRDDLAARGVQARIAAYTSESPAGDAVALAAEQGVDLVLVDARPDLLEEGLLDAELAAILGDAQSDVAVLAPGARLPLAPGGAVVVPFGGDEHDWAAIELAAWLARALELRLRLVGTSAQDAGGRRDASRLLARASLIVQAVVGIVCEPDLVEAGPDAMPKAAATASLAVMGFSNRWRGEGLGTGRLEVARSSGVPTLLVRRGLRPGGLAPQESMTRFTWTIAADSG